MLIVTTGVHYYLLPFRQGRLFKVGVMRVLIVCAACVAAACHACSKAATLEVAQNQRAPSVHDQGCFTTQDIIQALLVGIAEVAPEGALSALLTDVLAEPSNWDTTLVGLQALQVILFEGPRQSSSSRAGSNSEVIM